MAFLLFLAILAAVVVFVTRPLWGASESEPAEPASAHSSAVADLEAARDAKYREIRDAELDHRTGKLSAEDFELIDRSLRREALEILRELDRVRGRSSPAEGGTIPAADRRGSAADGRVAAAPGGRPGDNEG